MTMLSEIQLLSGVPSSKLKYLAKWGLEFEEEGFEIDAHHRKAIYDLKNKRLSPYLLAYALRCRDDHHDDNFERYDNLTDLARLKGLSISDGLADLHPKRIPDETLSAAQFWLDRACEAKPDQNALKRIASWSRPVIANAPFPVGHAHLAVRLLYSLPYEAMPDYPRRIQKTLNRTRHYGHLDGWFRTERPATGKPRTIYFPAKFDL